MLAFYRARLTSCMPEGTILVLEAFLEGNALVYEMKLQALFVGFSIIIEDKF